MRQQKSGNPGFCIRPLFKNGSIFLLFVQTRLKQLPLIAQIIPRCLPERDSFFDHRSLGKLLASPAILSREGRAGGVAGVHQNGLRLDGGGGAALQIKARFNTGP
jgi:hypothetical protein